MQHTPHHPQYTVEFAPITPDGPWLIRDWSWNPPPPQLLGHVLMLQCPVRGFHYHHHDQVVKLGGLHEGWPGDGEALKLSLQCKNNHTSSLNLAFHKG